MFRDRPREANHQGAGTAANFIQHTNECGVAACRMDAVSVISTMNVERPACNSSQQRRFSEDAVASAIVAEAAGTYAPAWARVSKAAVRMAVLLPAMLGPVTGQSGFAATKFDIRGTNSAPNSRSKTGWRASRSHSGFDHVGPDRSISSGVAANVASTSICDQRRRSVQVVGHRVHLVNALVKSSCSRLWPVLSGGEDFFFPSFEFFGDVTLAVPQRLLAHPMRALSRGCW